jgi:hypothetical protein
VALLLQGTQHDSRKMVMDAAILIGLGFAAGYGVRAWISTSRRRAIRKALGD